MTREELLQATRAILKGLLTLTDAQCLAERNDDVRASLPYVVVSVTVHDLVVGSEELIGGLSGSDPTWTAYGQRRGTVTLTGYGAGSEDWLSALSGRLAMPAAQVLFAAQGVSLHPTGGVPDLSRQRDTGWERIYVRELAAQWKSASATETAVAAGTVGVTLTYPRVEGEAAPPALSEDVTIPEA